MKYLIVGTPITYQSLITISNVNLGNGLSQQVGLIGKITKELQSHLLSLFSVNYYVTELYRNCQIPIVFC